MFQLNGKQLSAPQLRKQLDDAIYSKQKWEVETLEDLQAQILLSGLNPQYQQMLKDRLMLLK